MNTVYVAIREPTPENIDLIEHIIGRHENITVVYIKAKSTYGWLKRYLKIVEERIHMIHNIGVPVTIIAVSRDATVLIGMHPINFYNVNMLLFLRPDVLKGIIKVGEIYSVP